MAVNYNDERFKAIEEDKKEALNEVEQTYGGMINESDKYYQAQIDASKAWADKQTQLQQEQTDFTIEKIEQEKEQAHKDYLKEQSGAYVDWQKQSGQYSANAEQMASQGLTGTGYSESSQVSMFNTYQNRVSTAREVFSKAVLSYENAIKDARLQNNSVLAEIAYNALQQQLELSLQGFQYKNQLILEKSNKKTETEDRYYARYQDVLDQINTENALAEEIRQYNQNHALQLKEYNESVRQFNKNYDLEVKQYKESIRQFDEEIKRLKAKDAKENALEIAKLEEQKKQRKQDLAMFEAEQELKRQQLAEEKRQFDEANKAKTVTFSSGGGGGSKSSSSGSSYKSKLFGNTTKTYAVNTAYYQGSKNKDCSKYGTFSNGYQPKGISGHGTLSKSGETIQIKTQTLSGQKQTVIQNVWKAKDGTKWYWEGRQNKYIQIK